MIFTKLVQKHQTIQLEELKVAVAEVKMALEYVERGCLS